MARTSEEAAAANLVFGARVRALRKERGWNLRGLAKKAGTHWTYLGQVERGERNASLFTILRIARGLSVDPGELLSDLSDAPVQGGTSDVSVVAEGSAAVSGSSMHEASADDDHLQDVRRD